jgi:opacity protein-like surface antigen
MRGAPLNLFVAVPFSVNSLRLTAAAGLVEYANLYHYFQNNNVLTPSIGTQRPWPIHLPDALSMVPVDWYQYYRSRDGTINGYGGALSASVGSSLSFGVSGMLLKGTSDDEEVRVERGHLRFYANYFGLDSASGRVSTKGTSDYSGQEFTISAMYHGRYVTVGVAVKPPTTITREFSATVDSVGISSTVMTGTDEVALPWRGSVGASIALKQNLLLGLEYELRPYESAEYKASDGTTSSPWLSSSVFRLGMEYHPLSWFSLRAGMRNEASVFQPEGAPLVGDPVAYSVYSTGCGLAFAGVRLDLAYEYALLNYEDMWQTNVNLNRTATRNIVASISYKL